MRVLVVNILAKSCGIKAFGPYFRGKRLKVPSLLVKIPSCLVQCFSFLVKVLRYNWLKHWTKLRSKSLGSLFRWFNLFSYNIIFFKISPLFPIFGTCFYSIYIFYISFSNFLQSILNQ